MVRSFVSAGEVTGGPSFSVLIYSLTLLLPGDISIVLREEAAMPGDYLYLTHFITNIFNKQWVTIWSTFNYISPGRANIEQNLQSARLYFSVFSLIK